MYIVEEAVHGWGRVYTGTLCFCSTLLWTKNCSKSLFFKKIPFYISGENCVPLSKAEGRSRNSTSSMDLPFSVFSILPGRLVRTKEASVIMWGRAEALDWIIRKNKALFVKSCDLFLVQKFSARLLCCHCCCSVAKSCPTLCKPMDCSVPGFPVLQYLLQFAKTHIHWVGDAIQPSHPVTHFSSCPQSSPASWFFPMSWLFTAGGQSTGKSASASVLPKNIQGWFPLVLLVWSPFSPRDSQESSPASHFLEMPGKVWLCISSVGVDMVMTAYRD